MWNHLLCQELHGIALYPPLRLLSHSSLSITIMSHLVSNPQYALSVSSFTLRAIFGGSVVYAVHCSYHGSP